MSKKDKNIRYIDYEYDDNYEYQHNQKIKKQNKKGQKTENDKRRTRKTKDRLEYDD